MGRRAAYPPRSAASTPVVRAPVARPVPPLPCDFVPPSTLGFQGFWTARRTLAGVEAMAMLAKGQVRAVAATDVPAQRAFVAGLFGLAA